MSRLRPGPEPPLSLARQTTTALRLHEGERFLERFDLQATVLLKEIRAQGCDGGITILRDYVATIKDRPVQRVVDRFETERQAQVDWASCGTDVHRGRRKARQAQRNRDSLRVCPDASSDTGHQRRLSIQVELHAASMGVGRADWRLRQFKLLAVRTSYTTL